MIMQKTLICLAAGLLVLAPSSDAQGKPSVSTKEVGLTRAQQRSVAAEIGLGVGLGIAHAGLGVGPELMLEAGARFKLSYGSLAVHLRGGYQRYTGAGDGEMPCEEDTEGPCVASDEGAYSWSLVEHAGRLSLPLTYRILPEERRITPYVTVAPGLYMLRSIASSYGLENKQFSAKFGIAAALGGQVRLGPGGLFLEAGYQWSKLDHRITGDSSVGAVRIVIGYRVQL